MEPAFAPLVDRCLEALDDPDPQTRIAAILLAVVRDPVVIAAAGRRTEFANLADLAVHRSDRLALLAGSVPPGFRAAPHNHNLWSVVGVCSGREDTEFFEREGNRLRAVGSTSVVAPGVLPNPADVIHAIHNPLAEPLVMVHAYGGDLFGVDRSSWDPETHEEIPFDWRKVRPKS